jgi:hypothetical protein
MTHLSDEPDFRRRKSWTDNDAEKGVRCYSKRVFQVCYGDGLSVPLPSPSDIAIFLVLAVRGNLGNATI